MVSLLSQVVLALERELKESFPGDMNDLEVLARQMLVASVSIESAPREFFLLPLASCPTALPLALCCRLPYAPKPPCMILGRRQLSRVVRASGWSCCGVLSSARCSRAAPRWTGSWRPWASGVAAGTAELGAVSRP